MKEQWKVIPGDWAHQYYVSSQGEVARKKKTGGYRRFGKSSNPYCYKQVALKRKSGDYAAIYVHRLVAEAFLHRPCGAGVVHHINHNRSDNRIQNLMWSTQSENIRFAWRNRREQIAEGGGDGVGGPAPLLCDLPLARIGSSQAAGDTSYRGWGSPLEVPPPEMLPVTMLEVSWRLPFWQDPCFDPGPEPRYTTHSQEGV